MDPAMPDGETSPDPKPTPGSAKTRLRQAIAVLAILAICVFALAYLPILSPEKINEARCESNCRQFMLGILQYAQDNDQSMPIAFSEDESFGPATAKYNTRGIGYGVGRSTGIPEAILPYVKNRSIFLCPGDHPMTIGDIDHAAIAATIPSPETTLLGLKYQQVYGTSYKFTHEAETNPFKTTDKTGFATNVPCRTGESDFNPVKNGAGECDLVASGERTMEADGTWTPSTRDAGKGMPRVITLVFFARPSETRIFADWKKSFEDKPGKASKGLPFHQDGSTVAYIDGHVKFVTSKKVYASGCDGADWAWDTAGSCNVEGLQRNHD